MSRSRTLLVIGLLAYLLAWFVPVIKDGTTLAKGGLPGWEAFSVALSPLIPGDDLSFDTWWGDALAVLSALSNVVVLWAAVALFRSPRSAPRTLQWLLLGAAILNAHWFVLNAGRGDLRLGYYLWAASFWLLAFASRQQYPWVRDKPELTQGLT